MSNQSLQISKMPFIVIVAATVLLVLGTNISVSAQTCPLSQGHTDDVKSHKLFLYFPTADDMTFPAYYVDLVHPARNVSPARAFNVADLNSMLGTNDQLIERIREVVVDDYCEFNVQVIATTTNPNALPSPPTRRSTIAIGSDDSGDPFGMAQEVDTGDTIDVDFGRVWAGRYTTCEGVAPPGAKTCTTGSLTSSNATLERWGQAIGGSAAHEAGHTYGLAHTDDDPPMDVGIPPQNGPPPLPGEDSFHRHLMPAGYNLSGEDRASYRRHFSDLGYSTLAKNVGLSIQTMHNWDLKNPNAEEAHSLAIDFLSTLAGPVTVSWSYVSFPGHLSSPWINPVVTSTGPRTYQGLTYQSYRITWSEGSPSWILAAPGVVPGGAEFHIGATFTGVDFDQPDPIIIQNVTLFDANSNSLILHPRLPVYDAGSLDSSDGTFGVNFLNPPGGAQLVMQNAIIYQLPRVASLESMSGDGSPLTRSGEPIRPWSISTCSPIQLRNGVRCVVAKLSDPPHVEVTHRIGEPDVYDCSHGLPKVGRQVTHAPGDSPQSPDYEGPICAGTTRDLFPSTTVYIIATFVEPNAKYYDPATRAYVVGPVTYKIFYQFAGIRDTGKLRPIPGSQPAQGSQPPQTGWLKSQWSLGPSTGASWPVGSMSSRFAPDFMFSVQLERAFTPHLAAGFHLGYHAFDAKHATASASTMGVTNLSLYGRFLAGTGTLRPYLLAGAGAYRFRGTWEPGFQAGLGLQVPITSRLSFTTGPAVHFVNPSSSAGNLRWIDGTLGFLFKIP